MPYLGVVEDRYAEGILLLQIGELHPNLTAVPGDSVARSRAFVEGGGYRGDGRPPRGGPPPYWKR